MKKIIENFDDVEKKWRKLYKISMVSKKIIQKMKKIMENFDGVEKKYPKNEKIMENFDGVEKCQKTDTNYRKFRW